MSSLTSEQWRSLSALSQRPETLRNLDALWRRAAGIVRRASLSSSRFLRLAEQVMALEPQFKDLSEARLREAAEDLRARYRARRETHEDSLRALALVREAADRMLGQRPYREQLAGAIALSRGCIVEMATGEGKTLTATMPAVIAGWRGRGCHVITVNDYLAKRDAQWMSRVYRALGLSVGFVQGESQPHERRAAYAADITYCTNKEVAADFLRDRLCLRGVPSAVGAALRAASPEFGGRLGRLVMRGLEHAIVDEADSILIDEAVTPLIIAGRAPNLEQSDAYQQAAALAREFEPSRDYTVDRRHSEIRLTREGHERLAMLTRPLRGIWSGPRRAEEMLVQALTAREFFLRDKHYVVRDEQAVIVDDFTGRLMPDRTWREGLHQAIEAKESLPVRAPTDTLARISFQRFFRLYRSLCGMTGTAAEEAAEFWQVYQTPVLRLPTHRPCIRVQMPDRVFARDDNKWTAAADEIEAAHRAGRPVLVGARTVGQSERLSELLTARNLPHQVLSATRHAEEADIIARAGEPGRITIATNMAGRGTDITLGKGVAELGGLHVVALERHDSRRIDRQLFGRAGRQGDPGSAVAILSLEDELVRTHAPKLARTLALRTAKQQLPHALAARLFNQAQVRAQRLARQRRAAVLRTDDWLDDALGFAHSYT